MSSSHADKRADFNLKVARINLELREMSDNPDKIALTMLQAGVKGVRQDASACVLSRYFKEKYALNYVEVTAYHVYLTDGVNHTQVDMTQASNRFIEHFDTGCYPDLDIDAQKYPDECISL